MESFGITYKLAKVDRIVFINNIKESYQQLTFLIPFFCPSSNFLLLLINQIKSFYSQFKSFNGLALFYLVTDKKANHFNMHFITNIGMAVAYNKGK